MKFFRWSYMAVAGLAMMSVWYMTARAEVRDVNQVDVFSSLLKNNEYVLAKFHAAWCGPCRSMKSLDDKIAQKFGSKLAFVQVDVDQSHELQEKYGIQGTPTYLMFFRGSEEKRFVGAMSYKDFESKVKDFVGGQ
ncbi:thioredoxin family protein [Candidatus Babeliales bacterium]|nr:thioredoxin family protein [Candidatus Babeliales bacterium]